MILALETSCDDTCAAVVTARRRDPLERDRVAGPPARPLRRSGARDSRPPPSRADQRRHRGRARAGRSAAGRRGDGGRDPRPGADRSVAGGPVGGQGAGRVAPPPAGARRPSARSRHGQHARTGSIQPPFLCLVASGGHTFLARVDEPKAYTVLGQTLDDAAGEAFDKGARLLGLGYPGGPEVDRLARDGDPEAYRFPDRRPASSTSRFSGLKTSLLYRLRDEPDADRADLAASYQRAIVEALTARVRQALEREGLERLAIGGGVAANSELRAAVTGARSRRLGAAGGALHRQRSDDRRRRPLSRADALPGLPGARCRGPARRPVADPVARSRSEPRRPVIRIGEPAAIEREAAAADALGEPRLEALELGDPGVDALVHLLDRRDQSRLVGARSGGSLASSPPISSRFSPMRWANTMKAIRRSTGAGSGGGPSPRAPRRSGRGPRRSAGRRRPRRFGARPLRW